MDSLDKTFKSYFPFIHDDIFTISVSIILITYSVLVVQFMSENVLEFFGNPIVKFALFLIIAYISRYNPTVALMITIAVVASIIKLNEYNEEMKNMENDLN